MTRKDYKKLYRYFAGFVLPNFGARKPNENYNYLILYLIRGDCKKTKYKKCAYLLKIAA